MFRGHNETAKHNEFDTQRKFDSVILAHAVKAKNKAYIREETYTTVFNLKGNALVTQGPVGPVAAPSHVCTSA